METLFIPILVIHIIGGGVGLLAGSINILRKKGDKVHRIAGKLFYYGMLTSAISSLALAMLHPNTFLFIVGIFTLYMVATGDRYLSLKQLASGQKPKAVDWALTVMMMLSGFAFMSIGIGNVIFGGTMGWVLIVFGIFSLSMVRMDIVNYTGRAGVKNVWLVAHLQRMIGAYIASLTAFLVVNNQFLLMPSLVAWLAPSAVLVPFIVWWSGKYGVSVKRGVRTE